MILLFLLCWRRRRQRLTNKKGKRTRLYHLLPPRPESRPNRATFVHFENQYVLYSPWTGQQLNFNMHEVVKRHKCKLLAHTHTHAARVSFLLRDVCCKTMKSRSNWQIAICACLCGQENTAEIIVVCVDCADGQSVGCPSTLDRLTNWKWMLEQRRIRKGEWGGTLIICSMDINLLNALTIVEKEFRSFSLLSLSALMRRINREENNQSRHTPSNGNLILIVSSALKINREQ